MVSENERTVEVAAEPMAKVAMEAGRREIRTRPVSPEPKSGETTIRLAFVTMVWRDYWLLEKWIAHNARLVPLRHLYVVNHGGDPEVDRIAAGYNVIHLPRDEVTIDLTPRRWEFLGGLTNGLLGFFDRVICTDVDEFLVYVGDKPDLLTHLAATAIEGDALAPVGLNLMPEEVPDATPEMPVLARTPHALLSAKYTKPCIAARPLSYTIGGHGLRKGRFAVDPEVVLLHLHYVTPDYRERMAARVEIVEQSRARNNASDTPKAMPARYWINWSRPGKIRERELEIFAKAAPMDVSDGFSPCAALLTAAMRTRQNKTVIEPAEISKAPVRVEWPEAWRLAI